MAVISPDTFDPLRRYVAVRLQQGVPIVDADENEREDIRRFELRAYLKWFVGNGVPEGVADAFRIEALATPAPDFTVKAGVTGAPDALRNVGRCLVDGEDVLIQADFRYTSQPLYYSQTGAAALAAALNVPVIPALPSVTGTATVYLDVWTRLFTTADEPGLVHPGLGTESCVRLRREYVVRVRAGLAMPVPGDSEYRPGHSYYPLARLERRAGDPNVNPEDLGDLRERRLLVAPATLIEDVLGVTADSYRRGVGRPSMSLRDAFNSMLRGEYPATPVSVLAPDPANDAPTYGLDFAATGEAVVAWSRQVSAANEQVLVTSFPPSSPGTTTGTAITSGTTSNRRPHLAKLPKGGFIVAYERNPGPVGSQDVYFKRGDPATLAAAAETPVSTVAAGTAEEMPFVVASGTAAAGGYVVFFWHHAAAGVSRWKFRRRAYTSSWLEANASWIDTTGVDLSITDAAGTSLAAPGEFHAVALGNQVWAAFRTATNDILVTRLPLTTGTPVNVVQLDKGEDAQPFLVPFASRLSLLWRGGASIWRQELDPASGAAVGTTQEVYQGYPGGGPGTYSSLPSYPTAALDPSGALVVVFQQVDTYFTGTVATVVATDQLRRVDPADPSVVMQLGTLTAGLRDYLPFAIRSPSGAIAVLWRRLDTSGNGDLCFRQRITVL